MKEEIEGNSKICNGKDEGQWDEKDGQSKKKRILSNNVRIIFHDIPAHMAQPKNILWERK